MMTSMVVLFVISLSIACCFAWFLQGITYKGEETSYFVFLGMFLMLGFSLPWVLAIDAGIFIPLIFFIF